MASPVKGHSKGLNLDYEELENSEDNKDSQPFHRVLPPTDVEANQSQKAREKGTKGTPSRCG
jgi:hypothetical protein